MIDVLTIPDFLDAAARDDLLAQLRLADGDAATVYGREAAGAVESHVRKATRVLVSPETRDRVICKLVERKGEIEEHFVITLGECEEPQFLRYQTGDFFVAHQDGNTPLIYDQSRFRKISIVIFLSPQSAEPAPDTYSGGSLILHGPYSGPHVRLPVAAAPGALVAFRAETTHEVTPLTHGERYTIVSWYR
ncbi:MAG TPA: 2OG-Fe(II) oxygenase [Blastocatellia bacterium]|jgi:predicted 2-oxoglutarate/Fe(II)-dependent dioxygenase YbiX|nr:2OG-Fe(II) oxygenase [Blastocatellia bacterium]HAF22061.1 2OG-Fe(II) oxygenase [Blastocatellia bacterium]HCX28464.1 2OG-Fe(II) oxygenase [Blastocatellia bacterium]